MGVAGLGIPSSMNRFDLVLQSVSFLGVSGFVKLFTAMRVGVFEPHLVEEQKSSSLTKLAT